MHKKLFSIGLVAMFAMVAVFAMSGTASAGFQFGNCLKAKALGEGPGSTCGTSHVFTPFATTTENLKHEVVPSYQAVLTKKPGLTEDSVLETPAFGSGLKCKGLSGQGVDTNVAGNGISEQVLTFEKCIGTGPVLEPCQKEVELKKQKLNGTEKIIGSVKSEAINGTEDEIEPTGFNVACSKGGAKTSGEETEEFGEVTGKIKCQTVAPIKNYQLRCNHATGLLFAGVPSNQTGYSEVTEAFTPLGKVYQK